MLIKFQDTLQKIILSDYNAIRYVYTFLSRYTTFTIIFCWERFSLHVIMEN